MATIKQHIFKMFPECVCGRSWDLAKPRARSSTQPAWMLSSFHRHYVGIIRDLPTRFTMSGMLTENTVNVGSRVVKINDALD